MYLDRGYKAGGFDSADKRIDRGSGFRVYRRSAGRIGHARPLDYGSGVKETQFLSCGRADFCAGGCVQRDIHRIGKSDQIRITDREDSRAVVTGHENRHRLAAVITHQGGGGDSRSRILKAKITS